MRIIKLTIAAILCLYLFAFAVPITGGTGTIKQFHVTDGDFAINLNSTWYYCYLSNFSSESEYKAMMAVALVCFQNGTVINLYGSSSNATTFTGIDTQ